MADPTVTPATSTSQSALPATGNALLDSLNALVTIGEKGFADYYTFIEKKTALSIAQKQANAAPAQIVTAPQTVQAVQADTIKTVALYGGIIAAGVFIVLLGIKFARK